MNAQIVSFHCVLKNKLGKVLGSSFNQDVINQLEDGDRDRRLCGLVAGIQNVRQGERRQFAVAANEAYGPYDPALVLSISRSEVIKGDRLAIGSEIVSQSGPGGLRRVYRVVQIQGDTLLLDANHPLAGQDLIFEIEIVSARDACSEDFEESTQSEPSVLLH